MWNESENRLVKEVTLDATFLAMMIQFGLRNPKRLTAVEEALGAPFKLGNVAVAVKQLQAWRSMLWKTKALGVDLPWRRLYGNLQQLALSLPGASSAPASSPNHHFGGGAPCAGRVVASPSCGASGNLLSPGEHFP